MNYIVTLDERFHRTRHLENVSCPVHIHQYMEMVVVTEGILTMQIKQAFHKITAGSVALIEPFIPHSFLSEQPNHCIVIEYSADIHPTFYDFLKNHQLKTPVISLEKPLYEYLLSLIPKNVTIYKNHDLITLQAVISPLCNAFHKHCVFSECTKKYDDTFFQVLEYINRNLQNDLSLNSVSKQVGIRPDSLSRIFTEKADLSFLQYVQNARICKACSLLKQGCSVSFSSYQSGFGSICTFNRVFKKIMQCTPKEFSNHCHSEQLFSEWNIHPLHEDTDPCISFEQF